MMIRVSQSTDGPTSEQKLDCSCYSYHVSNTSSHTRPVTTYMQHAHRPQRHAHPSWRSLWVIAQGESMHKADGQSEPELQDCLFTPALDSEFDRILGEHMGLGC